MVDGWLLVINGQSVRAGDVLTDFRGDSWKFVAVSRPPEPGKSGKVLVEQTSNGKRTWAQEFYPSVFNGALLQDSAGVPTTLGHEVAQRIEREKLNLGQALRDQEDAKNRAAAARAEIKRLRIFIPRKRA